MKNKNFFKFFSEKQSSSKLDFVGVLLPRTYDIRTKIHVRFV